MIQRIRLEGFWKSNGSDSLPFPRARTTSWEGKVRFLDLLQVMESVAQEKACKGYSYCRVCGDNQNGTSTYFLEGWRWPSGYSHYISKHNIRPSKAFEKFILGDD